VALYDGRGLANEVHLVHCENIPERSSLHDWEIEPHVHDAMLQILYVMRGGGEVFIDDRSWTLDPPCLVVIPAQRVHGFHWDRRIDGPVITAAQRPLEALLDVMAPELRAVLREPHVLPVDPQGRHGEALLPLFDAIARETRTSGLAPGMAALSLLAALVVQVARIADSGVGAQGDPRSRKAQHVERFRMLLDAHLRDRWPVARYAREIGVTPGQLGRLCRELLGMSTLDAINARVLLEAQRSLVYSTLSVKQVAAELGFDDEAYFGRFFKKHAGAQPTAFRVAGRRTLAAVPTR
jgi:AraC family transcriptional regulator, transcriptional activator of pobA